MTPIDRYRLQPHSGPYESWPAASVLLADGQPTPTRVPGFVIEAQYRSPWGDVLITSFDCLFEESNAFVLLNGACGVVARQQLGAPYASFLLHEHWPIDPLTLGLHYDAQHFYRLRVVPGGRWWRRSPRLRLERQLAWRDDPRMVQAQARLQARVAAVAAIDPP